MERYFEKTLKNLVDIRVIGLNKSNASQKHLFKYDMYPEKLYKYRSCGKESFDALKKDYVYSPHPKLYTDQEDSVVYLGGNYYYKGQKGKARLCKEFVKRFWRENSNSLTGIGLSKKRFYEIVNNYILAAYTIDDLNRDYKVFIKDIPSKEKKDKLKKFKRFVISPICRIEEKARNVFSRIERIHRDNARVCCLTDLHNNRFLWENYTSGNSGFVVEYSKPQKTQIDEKARNLMLAMFPVEYEDDRQKIDISPVLIDAIKKRSMKRVSKKSKAVLFDTQKQILKKKSDFSKEREWRIILNDKDNSQFSFPYATAVYCGYKIKENDYKRVKEICNSKGLSLFQQRLGNDGTLYYEKVCD